MDNVVTQIQFIVLGFTICLLILSAQSVVNSRIMKASFGWIEASMWILSAGFRIYGLNALATGILKAQAAGMLGAKLNRDQWIGIGGGYIFMMGMIFSKWKERRAIKKTLGI